MSAMRFGRCDSVCTLHAARIVLASKPGGRPDVASTDPVNAEDRSFRVVDQRQVGGRDKRCETAGGKANAARHLAVDIDDHHLEGRSVAPALENESSN